METEFLSNPSLDSRMRSEQSKDLYRTEMPTVEEQFQYDDLVRRALLFMSDTRKPKGANSISPSDAFLKSIRKESMPLEQSLGMAVAEVIRQVTENGKNQGYEYDPNVILESGEELVEAGYLLAKAGGVIKQGPKTLKDGGTKVETGSLDEIDDPVFSEQLSKSGMSFEDEEGGDESDYEASEEEEDFFERVLLQAANHYGAYLQQTGQIDEQGYKQLAQRAIQFEQKNGMVEEGPEFGIDQEQADRILLERDRV